MKLRHLVAVFLLNLFVVSIAAYWLYDRPRSTPDNLASVVAVWSGTSAGSGFSIGNKWIVSAAHVLQPGKQTYVQTRQGSIEPARIIRRDPIADLVLLRIKVLNIPPLDIDCSYVPEIKDPVEALGIHSNNNVIWVNTFHRIASNMKLFGRYPDDKDKMIVVQPTYQSGMSGGALLNYKHKVVGVLKSINYAGTLPSDAGIRIKNTGILGMSVPPDVLCDFIGKVRLGL